MRPAANVFDDLAEGEAEGRLEQAAIFHIAGDLDRHRATRPAHAVISVSLAAFRQNERHGGKRENVVDDGRFLKKAFMCRQRRLGANNAALAFEAFQQSRFFAADIGTSAETQLNVEIAVRTLDLAAEPASLARPRQRLV